jgi:hypothetical protein
LRWFRKEKKMGVKISELTEANSIQNSDLFAIVQNGETKKLEASTLLDIINNTTSDLIKTQTVQISLTTIANGFVYNSASFSIPTGYEVLTATIIGNGYLSEVISNIISLGTSNVVINAFSNAVKNTTITIKIIYIKSN